MSNPFFMDTKTKNPKTMESLEEPCLSLEDENAKLAAKVEWYEQQFKLSQQKRFGASSEKMDPDQISFFDEMRTKRSRQSKRSNINGKNEKGSVMK